MIITKDAGFRREVARPSTFTERWVPFGLGLASAVFVPLVGQISLLEIACLLSICGLILVRPRLPAIGYSYLISTAILTVWLCVLAAYRFVDLEALAKVSASYVVGGVVSLLLVRMLLQTSITSVYSFMTGMAFASIGWALISPSDLVEEDPWKYGIGGYVALLAVVGGHVLWKWTNSTVFPILLVSSCASYSIAVGSRALGLVLFVAVVVWAVTVRAPYERRAKTSFLVALIAAIAVTSFLINKGYTELSINGTLGQSAQQKFESQNGDLGVLVGGRRDMIYTIYGIRDTVVLGGGAVPTSPLSARLDAFHYLLDHHYPPEPADIARYVNNETITLHSIFVGSFARAGVFSLPFVLILAFLLWECFRFAVLTRSLPVAFLATEIGWDACFSPMALQERTWVALACAIGIVAYRARMRIKRGEVPTSLQNMT